MRTSARILPILLSLTLGAATVVYAQAGDGTLTGYVKDDTGAVLPGVTLTATSPAMIGARTAVSDGQGAYRLVNLPPGQYVLVAELQGFTTVRQELIVMRAGATLTEDIQLKVGGVSENVTVSGDAPMLDVGATSLGVNVPGELVQQVPIQGRRQFSDFLDMTTGMVSRPLDDNSGRILYVGHGVDSWAYVIQLEGNDAVNYQDAGAQNIAMTPDLIADVNVKIAGIPASEPMGNGLIINIATKSGGDRFSGSLSQTLQPIKWNGANTPPIAPVIGSGTPAGAGQASVQEVNQPDATFGGPIVRQKAWFFGAYRYQHTETAVGFSAQQVTLDSELIPGWQPYYSSMHGSQPYLKVTDQISAHHQLAGYWQFDRISGGFNRSIYATPISIFAQGGSIFGVKLTSTWGQNTTSTIQATYNNKSGATQDTFNSLPGSGPQIDINQSVFLNSGLLTGSGALLTTGNVQSLALQPSSMTIFRGDITHHKEGWGGSHQFQTGIYAAPWLRTQSITDYVNNGFVYEQQALLNSQCFTCGTYTFNKLYVTTNSSTANQLETVNAHDTDIGLYVQDSWKPTQRLTLSAGLRVDYVKRYDALWNFTRMKDWPIGPRFSATYLLTADARNVLRFSGGRLHEQVNGRDASSGRSAGNAGITQVSDYYSPQSTLVNEIVTPPLAAKNIPYLFSPNLHQPYTDEYVAGFQKQFPGRLSLDASYVQRRMGDVYALVDINGIYPSGPGQPFGGFGLIDPTQGIISQETNATWNKYIYNGVEATVTKQMAHNWQLLVGVHRQWQHYTGTWNPTDPAKFIQPTAFPGNQGLLMVRGNYDQNTLNAPGLGPAYTPTWRKYSA
ncbi:MAG TPA: carboxypeptidase regulatory-like domain-containing protein, partial [Vicinamibacterales bacterium]|nr:carboxypeptidase regulatory-like domain-containing protein [Vicinamibacterales bacterium]